MSQKSKLLNILIFPVLILAGAGVAGFALFNARDEPSTADPKEKSVAVETLEVHADEHTLDVTAAGTVIPARRLDVVPQASGRLTWLYESLDPGTFVEEGQTLFRIDSQDYQRTIEELEAAVKQAQAQLDVERGQHEAAKEEWEHYSSRRSSQESSQAGSAAAKPQKEAPPLAVRGPQLAAAEANLQAAQARLATAKTQMSRTRFRAPFNAVIVDSSAEVSQLVGPSAPLVTLVGTDKFRVRVSLRTDRLNHIAIPGIKRTSGDGPDGSQVTVSQHIGDQDVVRTGRVLRLLSNLEPGSRMARLLVEVDDPYGLAEADDENARPYPMLLDAYVDVRIEGQNTVELIELPRKAVREGDRAFVVDQAEGRLAIRDLTIEWRRPDTVLVASGLEDGDRVITSPLATPVEGMKLKDLGRDGVGEDKPNTIADEEATVE
jgi:multidrug efflux pump subunit AcrA (membrane-fusion protein)